MKFLAGLVLLFAFNVNAQIPACTSASQFPLPTTSVKPIGAPDLVRGTCKSAVETNAVGGAVAFWCQLTPQDQPKWYLYAVRWSAITGPMRDDFMGVLSSADPASAIQAMTAKYQNTSVLNMCDVWEPVRDRFNAMKPVVQAAPAWVVARYSGLSTRPAFPVVAGVRSLTSTSRAFTGSVCDPSITIVEGASTYMTFSGAKGSVTLCSHP